MNRKLGGGEGRWRGGKGKGELGGWRQENGGLQSGEG